MGKIGNEAMAIQAHLRKAGFVSELYAEKVHPRMARLARPLWRYAEVSSPDTVCPPMPNTPCCARSVSTERFTLPYQRPTMQPMPRLSRTTFALSLKPMPGVRSQPGAT